jgi:hypothetical protein
MFTQEKGGVNDHERLGDLFEIPTLSVNQLLAALAADVTRHGLMSPAGGVFYLLLK